MHMVRTIRIIGITALLLAGLVLTVFMMDRRATDLSMERTPTVIERFKQSSPRITDGDAGRAPPLVQQAMAFALYLNPPSVPSLPPASSKRATAVADSMDRHRTNSTTAVEVRPESSSPKFELHGISYYRADPDRSMAMICEAGGSRRWVCQGDQLGHITIERIERDCILYQDGMQSQTMALASSDAIQKFALKADGNNKAPKPSYVPNPSAPAPPPVRGMRQMPPSRVAAKLGKGSLATALPDPDRAEAQ